VTHSVTGKVEGIRRTTPDSDDWLRRYLRRRNIPCEGEALEAALGSLDGPTWNRLKAAWRKREERHLGPMSCGMNRAYNAGKRLGPIWQRLIALGVIAEEDARLIAEEPSLTGSTNCPDFFGDFGAKFVLSLVLGEAANAARKRVKRTPAPASQPRRRGKGRN
jgi:hypothetical protein